MYIILRNILRFLVVILFQVLVMDNVMINGYLIPQVYLLFILLMPFETPRWMQLVSGFLLGMGIDLFLNTPGMHTFATVAVAFVRPYFLNLLWRLQTKFEKARYKKNQSLNVVVI